MAKALVGLGANSGDRLNSLQSAVAMLNADSGISVLATSNWHATNPVGGPEDQPEFLNGALVLETMLSPLHLLRKMQEVENRLGRRRQIRWGARTLDLDLLLYDDFCSSSPELIVPHPRMIFRPFVLLPALAVAAEWVHPVLGWTIRRLADFMKETPTRVELCGFNLLGRRQQLEAVAHRCSAGILAEANLVSLGRFLQWGMEQQMSLLRSRAKQMKSDDWHQPEKAIISGFCLEESLIFDGGENAKRRTELASWHRQIPTSKLTIIGKHVESSSEEEKFFARLQTLITETGRTPLFSFTADSQNVLIDEIAAAIECLDSWTERSCGF